MVLPMWVAKLQVISSLLKVKMLQAIVFVLLFCSILKLDVCLGWSFEAHYEKRKPRSWFVSRSRSWTNKVCTHIIVAFSIHHSFNRKCVPTRLELVFWLDLVLRKDISHPGIKQRVCVISRQAKLNRQVVVSTRDLHFISASSSPSSSSPMCCQCLIFGHCSVLTVLA